MIRVSTEAQRLEDQKMEMVEFCHQEGYDELVIVEDKGASAIKLNDTYKMMIEQVKEEIQKDKDITCFAVWELSRAFRNELVFQQVKQFLVERGIQFLVKNPYLKLLNPDGTVNKGMEVAVTLMATLASQEMQIKKERFHRAKSQIAIAGKFTGGRCTKFGYMVDGDGYIVPDPETAPQVKLIFELYSIGRYSVRTLYEEMKERGYDINYHLINRMVGDRRYIDSPYPKIISRELWEKCEEVRKKNFISIPKGRRHCFGSGIFRCYECGCGMLADGDQYRCRSHKKYSAPPRCGNQLTIRIENLDGLLWFIAATEETKYRLKLDQDKREEFRTRIQTLREKKDATQKRLDKLEEKKERIKELYVDGIIKKEEFEKRLSGALTDSERYRNSILRFDEEIGALLPLVEGNIKTTPDFEKLKGVIGGLLDEENITLMDEIVKRHIRKVTSRPYEFKGRKSAQLITIETVFSGDKRFIYVARQYKGHYFFTEKGLPLHVIRTIKRESAGEKDPRAFKKLKDW